jgi:autotransporter translocation and assembly factor TamB
MDIDFRNFDLGILNTYILYNTRLGGSLLGNVKITKTINKPDLYTSLMILHPVFDKISANSLRLSAKATDSMLDIANIYLTDNSGSYYGQGTVPLDIELLKGKFVFDEDREMEVDLFSEIASIPALPQYVEEIQSLKGDMIITLKFNGSPSHPETSGKLDLTNGVIHLTDLENPIFDLNGSFNINNNIVYLENMTGKLKKQKYTGFKTRLSNFLSRIFSKKILDPNKPNVNITGYIDLNNLSRPELNMSVKARDAYIRTPLGEQEGVADIDMTIAGRDTLFVDGDVLVKNFTVRNELVSVGETFEEPPPDAIHTELNLHVNSPGNFFIQNSQLDSELEGEAWLMKSGTEDFKISGDFTVLDGSLYYFQWIFKNLSGNIIFTPDELNPTLDLQATVDLSGYTNDNTAAPSVGQAEDEENIVTIYLTGDLEKPNLQFESMSDQYDQSSILRILTGTDQESLSDINENAKGFVMNNITSLLQRQFERKVSNFVGLSEFQVKTDPEDLDDQISFMMGRRITTNLYVTFERDFDKLTTDPTNSVGLRYRIDKKKSISGQINNNGLFEIKYRFRQHY